MATFTKLKSGKTRAQVRLAGVYENKSFFTKGQAEKWSRQIEMTIQDGTYQKIKQLDNMPILSSLIERYRSEITPHKKSAKNERSVLNILTRHAVADFRVDSIQSTDIDELMHELFSEGLLSSSVRRYLSTLRHLFTITIKRWKIKIDNPFSDVELPKAGKARERRLGAEEEILILQEARQHRNPEMLAIVELAIETGMRRGEILKMEWSQINFEQRVVSLFDTKNETNRGVPLSRKALNILTEHNTTSIDSKVFHYTADGFKSSWKKLLDRTGIVNLYFHDFRHEATSRFFERGLNLMEVASITGHKDLSSLKRYTHLEAYKLADKL